MLAIPAIILAVADEGDRGFLEALYLENAKRMFRAAYAIVEDYQLAEDMVSEACVRMVENIDRLRKLNCCILPCYLVSIVRNVSYSFVRKRNWRSKQSFLADNEDVFSEEADMNGVEDELIQRVEIEELYRAIALLNERERDILRMKYYEKCTDAEIAQVLGLSENSVRMALTRARRALGKILEGRL